MVKDESEEIAFGVRLAGSIKALYWGTLIFVFILLIIVFVMVEMSLLELIVFYGVFIGVFILFLYILYRAYNMRYQLDDTWLKMYGAMGKKEVRLQNIEKIEKTAIPFGFRMFGASFLGGWYYLPGIGKAWVAMGNFNDGVLITTDEGLNIVLTPDNPTDFIETVMKRKKW